MFKFLRKYNKWILAVGGTLLMIVFLIPQAISSLSQRAALGSAVWATVGEDGDEVPGAVRRQCVAELEVLERLSRVGFPVITEDPEHWYLLVREAEAAGLVGGRASDQVPPDQMGVLYSFGGRPALTEEAVGKSLAIGRMMTMYRQAARLSDARLHRAARRLFHSVDTRIVVLEAEARSDDPEPTAEAIATQFEKYRDVVADGADGADGADTMTAEEPSFGYRLPDRFKIEWLRIDAGDVQQMIADGDALDGVSLFKHWKRTAQSRGFPPVEAGAPVPEVVRQDLLNELTTERLEEIERFVTDRLLSSWRGLEGPEGYLELPDDWDERRLDLAVMARDLQEAFPGLALPTYQRIGDRWLAVEDLREIDDIDRAGTDRDRGRSIGAEDLVTVLQEFGGDPVMLAQAGVTGPPLRDRFDNSVVFFRVTGTDPARPPLNVDEVRGDVVRDLRRAHDYERLLARRESIETTAREQGLLTVALEHASDVRTLPRVSLYSTSSLDFQLQYNLPLAPVASPIPVIGSHLPTVEHIIDAALALPPDTPMRQVPVEQRTFVVPVPARMALLVVEMTGQTPLDHERFEQLTGGGALQAMLQLEELIDLGPNPEDVFTFEAMAERHRFEVKRKTDDDSATTAPDATTTTPPAEGEAG